MASSYLLAMDHNNQQYNSQLHARTRMHTHTCMHVHAHAHTHTHTHTWNATCANTCRDYNEGGSPAEGGEGSAQPQDMTPQQQHQQYLGDSRPELPSFPDIVWAGTPIPGMSPPLVLHTEYRGGAWNPSQLMSDFFK